MPVQSLYNISHWNAKIIQDVTPVVPNLIPKGIITDLSMPTLEREMDTTKRAGELGAVARPKLFNELEMSFTMVSVFREMLEALTRGMQKSFTLEATACIEPDTGAVLPYIVSAKGFVSSMPFGDLSPDGFESEITMMCYYMSATLGTTAIIYDPRNYVLSLNGTNLFADVKTIIDPAP